MSEATPAVSSLPLACPRCQGGLETDRESGLHCRSCGTRYPIVDGIPTFVDEPGYWGEIPRDDMEWLLGEVRRGRPWRKVVLESERPTIREKARFILDPRRGNWILDLPLPPAPQILDIGAGLGGVSAALAPYAGRVVALEPVDLRARFALTRFAQDGVGRVAVVRGGAHDLPFAAGSFDVVVMNGVLEWVGRGAPKPRAAQETVLRRIGEVLRPGGTLVVAIENRIGIWFFIGRQDHSYLPFTSLMPRWLASVVTRLKRGHRYDTYTYTHTGYRRLFSRSGFSHLSTLLPIRGYNTPDYLVPLEPGPRDEMRVVYETSSFRVARRLILRRLNAAFCLSRTFANDFIFFARRTPESEPGWLKRILAERWAEWGLAGEADRLSILVHNRSHPTVIVFADGVKQAQAVVRLSSASPVLEPHTGRPGGGPPVEDFSQPRVEIEGLRRIGMHLRGSLAGTVPRPLDLFRHGVHELGVTAYVPGRMPLLPNGGAAEPQVRAAASRLCRTALSWLTEFHQAMREPSGPGSQSGESASELYGGELADSVAPGVAAALPDGTALAAELRASLAPLGSLGRVVRVPQHGDFVVSNLRLDDSRLCVIDWERFGRIPMPGFDAVHFVTHLALLLLMERPGQIDHQAAARFLLEPGDLADELRNPLARYLEAQGLDPEHFPVLLPAYLAAFIGEYGVETARRGIVGGMGELLRAVLAERRRPAGSHTGGR